MKKLRLQKGLSLQAVADEIKASKAHVWELETGKSENPSLKLLKSLANLYGVPLARLIGEMPDENDTADDLLVMFRDLKELDDGDRETLKGLIDVLKNKSKG
ncbi:helix-turn-helix transcriptional regulator [Mariprofundus ferrooxydans]|nr:helix-turn-helix transcriptional regulator [Mariprofundus ferrooxydans]